MGWLRWLPTQRVELLSVALLVVAMEGLLWWNRATPVAPVIALVTLELLLPLALGLIAAGLLASDPVLEVLLSVPQPAPRTLAQRLGVLLGVGLWLGGAVVIALVGWEVPMPQSGWRLILLWAAPLLFWVGLASAGALVRGQLLDGAGLVLGVWAISFLSIAFIEPHCATVPLARPCHAALWSPVLTLLRPLDPWWLLNRIGLLVAGLLLLALALRFAQREERLL